MSEITPEEDAFMRSLYRQLEDLPMAAGFDAEAGAERLRVKMAQMRQDPAEDQRIAAIADDADAASEEDRDGMG
jgi:hypothetical protein